MRKTVILLLVVLCAMNLFAQVDSHTVKTSKMYEAEIKGSEKIRNKASLNTKPALVYESKFANHVKQGEYFKAVFKLDSNLDKETMQQICITLKKSNFITDANYRGNADFEIFAFEPMYPEQVNQLLEQYNVKISEDSIKHK
ncbi:MAG: hypothetical protein ACP5DZ_04015 [Bacteroidales bacterium]